MSYGRGRIQDANIPRRSLFFATTMIYCCLRQGIFFNVDFHVIRLGVLAEKSLLVKMLAVIMI